MRPELTRPARPRWVLLKVPTWVVFVFATSRAKWISSFATTRTPRPPASGSAAVATALKRFMGPSALIAVAGRMAPTSTTGFELLTTRLRKYAVSSIVSVPCVITTPATSGRSSAAWVLRERVRQTASPMSWLPMLATCSTWSLARRSIPGAAAIRDSIEKIAVW
jgi:hypothetical protein